MLRCALLCYIMGSFFLQPLLCYAMLCYAMLCYVMLCYTLA